MSTETCTTFPHVFEGKACRIVKYDPDGSHKDDGFGDLWLPYPETPRALDQIDQVAEFMPKDFLDNVPSFLRPRPSEPKAEDDESPKVEVTEKDDPPVATDEPKVASKPSPKSASAKSPKDDGLTRDWTPFTGDKFAYGKALRDAGRVLTGKEFQMLRNMETYADADLGGAFPGHQRLGEHMGYEGANAARQAGKYIRELERKGFVLRVSPGTSAGRAAVYRLGLPAPDA